MKYDVKAMKENPCVYKADAYGITLKTAFRVKLFKLWKEGNMTALRQMLEDNGLGQDKTGLRFFDQLIVAFQMSGYPLNKKDEYRALNGAPEDNPLILSGKYVRLIKGNGLRIAPDFENELFSSYPEVPVEEGLRRAGLDILDVGRNRIRKLEQEFSERARKLYGESAGQAPHGECEKPYEPEEADGRYRSMIENPYVEKADGETVVLREAFYNEAYLLAGMRLDELLRIYDLDASWFSECARMNTVSKLFGWKPTEERVMIDTGQALRIARKRERAMSKSLQDGFLQIREQLPETNIVMKKCIARWISTLPRDPWGRYTTGRILQEVGLAKSTYYELLTNEDYGMSAYRRLARDDEDILLVKEVAEYKGYAKGYRQISMMMETVTGKVMSEHRVLYLMRKYGMRTNIRRPSKNRKAMKELMKRNGKENLLMRRFKQHRPNQVRLTDVTYLDYGDGLRAYGSASIDPVTNRLICFVISEENDLQLAIDTLGAMDAYPAVNGGIIHSDQGILYFTDDFQAAVADRSLIQSMSRRGNCWDNAPQESFFGHFKDESGYRKCKTLDELRKKVQDYSKYYNEERGIHSRGKMTPVEYEAYLCALDEDAFAAYMAAEEEKYLKKKEEAAAKAAGRARERREAIEARLEEITNETGRQEGKVYVF